MAHRRCLNAGTNDDNEGTDKHARSATKSIIGGTRKKDCGERANVVHSSYNTGARARDRPLIKSVAEYDSTGEGITYIWKYFW